MQRLWHRLGERRDAVRPAGPAAGEARAVQRRAVPAQVSAAFFLFHLFSFAFHFVALLTACLRLSLGSRGRRLDDARLVNDVHVFFWFFILNSTQTACFCRCLRR